MFHAWRCAVIGLGISSICFGSMLFGMPKEVAASLLLASAIAGTLYFFRQEQPLSKPLTFCLAIALPASVIFNLTAGVGFLIVTVGAIFFWTSCQNIVCEIGQMKQVLNDSRKSDKKDK